MKENLYLPLHLKIHSVIRTWWHNCTGPRIRCFCLWSLWQGSVYEGIRESVPLGTIDVCVCVCVRERVWCSTASFHPQAHAEPALSLSGKRVCVLCERERDGESECVMYCYESELKRHIGECVCREIWLSAWGGWSLLCSSYGDQTVKAKTWARSIPLN